VVPTDKLDGYRYSSYWYLFRPKQRPAFLQLQTALEEVGGLADTAAGRRGYAAYLGWQATDGPAGKSKAYVSLSQGWALGTKEFKSALVKDHALAAESRAWASPGAREIREIRWAEALARSLRLVDKTLAMARTDRKSAPWKAAIALHLKQTTPVRNSWLAEQLHMGRPAAVGSYITRLKAARLQGNEAYQKLINQVST